MSKSLFLASLGLNGLSDFLDEPPSTLQLLYIPTAANAEDAPAFAHAARETLAEMGFQIDDLDLESASLGRVAQAVAACDVIYVGGGNTYYLLDWVNKSGFRDALARRDDVVYVGSSAGAIIAAQDIAYIGDVDDPGAAPTLQSTTGLGMIDICVMPHADDDVVNTRWNEIITNNANETEFVCIRDDQAIAITGDQWKVVSS
jgi:dipeptidase E